MKQPLVSVIIRTCNRPDVLKQAIDSICRQTYKNVEIIVVEDGKNVSKQMIDTEYFNCNIKYYCIGEKKGRSKAGNIGLEKASGQYYNFLDDDDILYDEHIETLVNVLQEGQYRAAYSIAEEKQIKVYSFEPYKYKVKREKITFAQPFNRVLLYHANFIPIQSIMFDKSLYEKLGGFDEKLDALEDWDLWVRYSTLEDFAFVEQITSAYFVNYERGKKKKRDVALHNSKSYIENKFMQYNLNMSVGEIHKDMDYVIKKYKTNQLKRYIRLIADFIIYGER